MKTPKFTTSDLLMGIEWEPQFTLLNYPKSMIAFANTTDPTKQNQLLVESGSGFVVIYNKPGVGYHQGAGFIDKKYKNMYCDGYNVEVYTNPVPLSDIKTEISKATETLKQFTNSVALKYGPTGVFLPMTRIRVVEDNGATHNLQDQVADNPLGGYGKDLFLLPSKHVNFSLPYYNDKTGKRKPKTFCDYVLNQPMFKEIVGANGSITGNLRLHINVAYDFNDYEKAAELVIEYANQGLFGYVYKKRTVKMVKEIRTLISSLQVKLVDLYLHKRMKKPLFLGYVRNNGFVQIKELV
jgi:hypothetical protein